LERGAGAGHVFRLRLLQSIFIGYEPAWNEAVITDTDTFPDRGEFIGHGVLDVLSSEAMAAAVAEMLPRHDFDAVRWSAQATQAMLRAVGETASCDGIAHSLAWAIWLLGEHPRWQDPATLPKVIDEVLRLHPPVWLGRRTASHGADLAGVPLKKGAVVGYSPYLTHRDPALWEDPAAFRPDRFDSSPRPWTYLPFGGGRDCARLDELLTRPMLMTALVALCEWGLTAMRDEESARGGHMIEPAGPLWVIPGLRAQSFFRRSAA
jgi:hypothetical protein